MLLGFLWPSLEILREMHLKLLCEVTGFSGSHGMRLSAPRTLACEGGCGPGREAEEEGAGTA